MCSSSPPSTSLVACRAAPQRTGLIWKPLLGGVGRPNQEIEANTDNKATTCTRWPLFTHLSRPAQRISAQRLEQNKLAAPLLAGRRLIGPPLALALSSPQQRPELLAAHLVAHRTASEPLHAAAPTQTRARIASQH
ncbi:hypothetical protein M409DRAFT_49931 [Zasmidium cellare ATCC 36951]|uniref:Uncharacterized protein n=1 Tax=Zasmidium cellare ATCC 36951 TaxID=1080233 RepID=A0A6A6CZM0_ZASCE|nr:uncharacterized protein M409DRAFT_49931 [Zasmidium cellare ATCC 36951]KAF2172203.1 hypothetical protein M409DRAFT_49931 [Zasmidium cellare ATCC 36951]